MSLFTYRDGVLHAEDLSVPTVARAVATPFYLYSATALADRYRLFRDAVGPEPLICFAVKANGNQAVLATLARQGAGADVVSEGEMRRALVAGIPADKIVFSGVGKSEAEIAMALSAGIFQFNVESVPELEAISAQAQSRGLMAPVALRVNPAIDAPTHAKIATGGAENKFGIPIGDIPALYRRAHAMPGIAMQGLALHIGSQILDLLPFRAAFGQLADLARALQVAGLPLSRLDLGGGLGIAYRDEVPPSFADYARMVHEIFADLPARLIFEPGRCLVGPTGILVSRVLYLKQGHARIFAVLDAGMNDLLRPAMYDAFHPILPVEKHPKTQVGQPAEIQKIDLVGPVCESSDIFAKDRSMPPLQQGDLVAIAGAGAYGAVMASTYNTRALIPEIMARGHDFAIVRPRLAIDALIAQDCLPGWL